MRLFCFFMLTLPLAAQTSRFTLGITGGVPLGSITSSAGREESKRYTFGPLLEISFTEHITVAVNPLYKRTGWSFPPYSGVTPEVEFRFDGTRSRSHSLELPVIGKYSFGAANRRWRPFLGSGFAFQAAWQRTETRGSLRNLETNMVQSLDLGSELRTPTDVGAVASAGISLRRGRFAFVPEIRYKRWGSSSSARSRHQADFLFSIRF